MHALIKCVCVIHELINYIRVIVPEFHVQSCHQSTSEVARHTCTASVATVAHKYMHSALACIALD